MPLPRRRACSPAAQERGYTIIEAAIAMLLTAIMAASMFSVALSTKRASGKGLRKLVADQGARQLTEQLKNYVTADWSANTVLGGISGPGHGANFWSLTDAAANISDDCIGTYTPPTGPWSSAAQNCYVFKSGSHTLTGLLPAWFEGSPFYARIQYWVDPNSYTVNAGSTPVVNVTVQWQEIQ